MGWTYYHATEYKPNGTVDRKAECDKLLSKPISHPFTILKSRMVGTTYYAAVQTEDENHLPYVAAIVILTHGSAGGDRYYNFGYKAISEESGPTAADCPKSILNLLTPTTNQWANEWRKRCQEKMDKTKLRDLPVGTKIKFTTYDGTDYTLVKMSPNYQFKRTWWYNPDSNRYMPSRRIPDNWEIIPA